MTVGQMLRMGVGGAGAGAGTAYSAKVLSYNPVAYWPLWEAAGGVAVCQVNAAQNGAYTGVTLGQTGIGDGSTCPLFDGANDYVDTYSATLAAAFDGDEGSMMCWVRVAGAGVWVDGLLRYPCLFGEDNANRLYLHKPAAANEIQYVRRVAGGTDVEEDLLGFSSTAWFNMLFTWSIVGGQQRSFMNGAEIGPSPSAISVYYVGSLASGYTCIGAKTVPPEALAFPWSGYLAHCALWDTPLTDPQIADLATV